jgi:hypothetical protein
MYLFPEEKKVQRRSILALPLHTKTYIKVVPCTAWKRMWAF